MLLARRRVEHVRTVLLLAISHGIGRLRSVLHEVYAFTLNGLLTGYD